MAIHDKEFNQLVKHFATCSQYKIDQPNLVLLHTFRDKLVKLRKAKMSWYGQTENAVRYAVDKFLQEN